MRLPRLAAVCAGLVVALSPWQIFMSRIALPGTLVLVCWTLCVWAGLRLIARGERRDALALALAAGIGLYAYPTLKLAVPLLVALALTLTLARHGWRTIGRFLLPAIILALLWLPFAYVTLFNSASGTRLNQTLIQAGSWRAWLAAWWNGYRVYFGPDFYFRSGDSSFIRGVPGHGVELLASAPLVLLGLLGLLWESVTTKALGHQGTEGKSVFTTKARRHEGTENNITTKAPRHQEAEAESVFTTKARRHEGVENNITTKAPRHQEQKSLVPWRLGGKKSTDFLGGAKLSTQNSARKTPTVAWWFLLGVVLLAPLPASLTQPSPHAYRAATIAPIYALLCGVARRRCWRCFSA